MNQDPMTTGELLERARTGDLDSKRALIDRYYPRVQRIVRARMGDGARLYLESGDLTQIVLVEILKDLDTIEFRSEGELMNWMSIEVERRLKDQMRRNHAQKRDRRREVSTSGSGPGQTDADGDSRGFDIPEAAPSPRTMTGENEEQLLVDACVHELPLPERTLIILRDYEGHRWDEVARITNRASADAARMAHGNAMKALAAKLRARGVRPDAHTDLGG